MAYPFPSIERKVYPKTFLKDVHILFCFSARNNIAELNAKVGEFFNTSFELEGITSSELEKGMEIFSKNGLVKFDFGTDTVELTVKQPEYRSYENISPLRRRMFEYLQLLEVSELQKLTMYKYNQLEYQAKNERLVKNVMGNVFSNDLLSDVEESKQGDYTRWEKTKQYSDEQSQVTIEYGFRKDANDLNRGFLTLKTQIESTKKSIALTDIEKEMDSFNQILDNGFHWCVKSEIINIMKQS